MSNQKTEFQRTPRHHLTFDFTLESLKDSLKGWLHCKAVPFAWELSVDCVPTRLYLSVRDALGILRLGCGSCHKPGAGHVLTRKLLCRPRHIACYHIIICGRLSNDGFLLLFTTNWQIIPQQLTYMTDPSVTSGTSKLVSSSTLHLGDCGNDSWWLCSKNSIEGRERGKEIKVFLNFPNAPWYR